MHDVDIIIVGAGAAGLTTAIFAGRALRAAGSSARVLLLEGAKKPGAKILVSGGGRCNVTNLKVTPDDYCGGSRATIRKVLRSFDEQRTVQWMAEMGAPLKAEPTGKLFPIGDQARTVLEALLRAATEAGVELRSAARVQRIEALPTGGFAVSILDAETITCRRLVLSTGGLSLPKSGSDGWGIAAARSMGHTIVPTTPALVPIVLRAAPGAAGRFVELSGISIDARMQVVAPSGKRLGEATGSLLFTHFGLSGPAALDISRYWLRARLESPDAPPRLLIGHPDFPDVEAADRWLLGQGERSPLRLATRALVEKYPERLARILGEGLGGFATMTRDARRGLAKAVSGLEVAVEGDRGYSFAETTAGGVALDEVDVRDMHSRRAPGLHLCGEMLDVDGRIGGFNFQWAWATGYLAGSGVARAVMEGAPGAP